MFEEAIAFGGFGGNADSHIMHVGGPFLLRHSPLRAHVASRVVVYCPTCGCPLEQVLKKCHQGAALGAIQSWDIYHVESRRLNGRSNRIFSPEGTYAASRISNELCAEGRACIASSMQQIPDCFWVFWDALMTNCGIQNLLVFYTL